MNPMVSQMLEMARSMPTPRKLIIAAVSVLLLGSFAMMFFWANKIDYQPLYTNLAPEDAAAIVEKLKALRVPYQLEGAGSAVIVPADRVHETRLTLAAAGLPKGSGVGFEVFDATDFGTTEFVQKLNYQRAVQGELARTIREFQEVEDARVMIVMPRDSVFVEETKPPSASVLLKLKPEADLGRDKVEAVVHLVARSIEDLKPEYISVVDTQGRVLYKTLSEAEKAGLVADKQLKYKVAYEQNLARRIQSMLERIVGEGNAIVRVTADMNFDKLDESEEIFDPEVQVIRSRKHVNESVERNTRPVEAVSTVNPLVDENGEKLRYEKSQKNDETINYEISKTVRRRVKPAAELIRLSVAAVLDGTYPPTEQDGKTVRAFVARTAAEMTQFDRLVRQAMGYNEDRGDQVSVECVAFKSLEDLLPPATTEGFDLVAFKREYGTLIANVLLVLLVFMFVIRPLIRTAREFKEGVEQAALPSPEEELARLESRAEADAEVVELTGFAKAESLATADMDKAANIIKGWLSEES